MTDQNYTDVTFIVDRSSSMGGSEDDTIRGFNKFLEEQKGVDGKCCVTTVLFDNQYEFLHEGLDIREVPDLNRQSYFVRGSTALNDAMGRAISEAGNRFAKMSENKRPGKVLFVVITDGFENASKEFTTDKIKEMVQHQQNKYDWDFVFIGADIDAFSVGGGYGIKASNYANVGKHRLFNAIQSVSVNTSAYRGAVNKGDVELTANVGDK